MTKVLTTTLAAGALLTTLGIATNAQASSHREAINTMNDPCIDNTDLYAWVDEGSHDNLNLLANLVPLHNPGQGNQQTRFCDDVLYVFHLSNGVTDLNDELVYAILFDSTGPAPVALDELDGQTPVGGGAEILIQLSGNVQTYRVYRKKAGQNAVLIGDGLPVAPPRIGPRTDRVAYGLGAFDPADPDSNMVGLYDDAFAATFISELDNGGRAWVGEREDSFYLDEGGIFDLVNLQPQGVSKDIFAGFNLMTMALEIPIEDVTEDGGPIPHNGTAGDDTLLAVHHTAHRRKVRILRESGDDIDYGQWVQLGRQGLPLVNAGLIGTQDQNKYLRTRPADDFANFGAYFLFPVIPRDLEVLGTYAALGVGQDTIDALKGPRTDILEIINLNDFPEVGAHSVPLEPGFTGDVLRLDIAIDSHFPNGRSIPGGEFPDQEQVDVSDVLLTVIASGGAIPISDGVQYNDKEYLSEFPYAALPFEGFSENKGEPTPPR